MRIEAVVVSQTLFCWDRQQNFTASPHINSRFDFWFPNFVRNSLAASQHIQPTRESVSEKSRLFSTPFYLTGSETIPSAGLFCQIKI